MMYSKPMLLELVDHAADALGVERVLVARLRRRQHVQVLDALVADQRLVQLGLAADHVDEVVDDAALAAHDQVEVAQADVEVDRDGLVPLQREPGRDVRAGGGLADPAFTRGDDDDFGHCEASFDLIQRAICDCKFFQRSFRCDGQLLPKRSLTAARSGTRRPRGRSGRGLPRSAARDLVGAHVGAGDRDQLGLQLLAEDARARQPLRAGDRAPAQRRVDVDVPVGDHLRARVDRRQHDEVVVLRVDDLAAAHRLRHDHGAGVGRAGVGARAPTREDDGGDDSAAGSGRRRRGTVGAGRRRGCRMPRPGGDVRGRARLGHVGGGDRHQLARPSARDDLDDGSAPASSASAPRSISTGACRNSCGSCAILTRSWRSMSADVRAAQPQHGERRHRPLEVERGGPRGPFAVARAARVGAGAGRGGGRRGIMVRLRGSTPLRLVDPLSVRATPGQKIRLFRP